MCRRLLIVALSLPVAIFSAKQAEVKVQKTSLSRDQEIQLGKEAALQVEREQEVIHNAEIEHWLNQIGQSLAKTPQANAYPRSVAACMTVWRGSSQPAKKPGALPHSATTCQRIS